MKTTLSPKKQNLLGCLAIVAVLIFGLFVYGAWRVYQFFDSVEVDLKNIPLPLREPRVIHGAEFLTKSEFFKNEEYGFFAIVSKGIFIRAERERKRFINRQTAGGIYEFEDLKIGELDGQKGLDAAAIRRNAAFIFDESGNLKRVIDFEIPTRKVKAGWFEGEIDADSLGEKQIVDVDADGKAEFFGRGSWDGAVLFDGDGKLIWRYGGRVENFDLNKKLNVEIDPYIEDSAIGDLNGDGKSEIVVGIENDGLRAFDLSGKELWRQEKKHIGKPLAIFDADGDGKNEVVEFNRVYEQESFLLTSGDGKLFKETKVPPDLNHISFLASADGKQTQALSVEDGKTRLADSNGKLVFEPDAPLSEVKRAAQNVPKTQSTPIYDAESGTMAVPVGDPIVTGDTERVYESEGVWVKLKTNEPKFLAVVGNFIGLNRAVLYVYSLDGKLVYHEILPEDAKTIAVFPAQNEREKEAILVGGKTAIWRYTAND